MEKISVIVPVYKVEPYLSRCVDSILAQTYRDFELILVDDGSPDRCGEICDAYAEKDNRVHVIHQKNGGLSAARNAGIDWAFANSSSVWLTCVDCDDWIHPQYLEILLRAAQDCRAPVSVCVYERPEFSDEAMMKPVADWDAEELTPECLLVDHSWNFNYAWGKLYHKKAFGSVRYPEGKNFEDTFTTYKVLFSGERVAFVDKPLYFYFKNEAGITRSPWTPKELVVFEAMKEQLAFYRENGFSRALEQEEKLYVNHFAYQITRIRENRADLKQNRPYLRALKKEMMRLVHQNPEKYGYRKMPQCYEAAYPNLMKIYHAAGSTLRKLLCRG